MPVSGARKDRRQTPRRSYGRRSLEMPGAAKRCSECSGLVDDGLPGRGAQRRRFRRLGARTPAPAADTAADCGSRESAGHRRLPQSDTPLRRQGSPGGGAWNALASTRSGSCVNLLGSLPGAVAPLRPLAELVRERGYARDKGHEDRPLRGTAAAQGGEDADRHRSGSGVFAVGPPLSSRAHARDLARPGKIPRCARNDSRFT